ncbi:hypothetical protein GUJ93_ZPchr0006g41680 [Zizania palustris]|uniref:Uncharacterized protein n=1 Tax=Zizania palustris TaxID=103762 RepID=A0A8J5T110_ZIZPA|nr:hypothetical protein GUJ93_ZPchr0006g41680 [Zizania palustris]
MNGDVSSRTVHTDIGLGHGGAAVLVTVVHSEHPDPEREVDDRRCGREAKSRCTGRSGGAHGPFSSTATASGTGDHGE